VYFFQSENDILYEMALYIEHLEITKGLGEEEDMIDLEDDVD
jgi:hypothetical protein